MLFNSDRFKIEPIKIQDSWGICNFVVANEDRLKRYFPITLRENLTPDLARIFTEKKVNQFQTKNEFLYTLKPNDGNEIIGLVYLKDLDWEVKHGELAYCISYNYEGNGITTEAVNVITNHAFQNLGLKTIKIVVHNTNLGSVKVAEKCNFTWIKTLKKEHTPPGEAPLDMELYELYKEIE